MSPNDLRRFYQAVLYGSVAVLVMLVLYQQYALFTITNRIDSVTGDIRETQKGSRVLLDFLKDCTEPAGKCYQASEARDAEQVGAINSLVIATAWCIHSEPPPQTRRELTVCVGKILDGRGHQ